MNNSKAILKDIDMKRAAILIMIFSCTFSLSFSQKKDKIDVVCVSRPSTTITNNNYIGNRAPLQPLSFIKLPVSSIKPEGWLLKCLELQRDGLAGNLGEISSWLDKKNNAWLSKDGQGDHGWEEVPYWLRGYANTGYILGDKKIIDESESWLNAIFQNQRPDGYFGKVNLDKNGRYEIWANMIMLNCLQSYYEYTGDERVIKSMLGYFRWEMQVPEEKFLKNYWENSRGGDNLASVQWLYNITGEPWLLQLASKIHRNTADWSQESSLPNWHNVNIAECFREPATWWLQSKDSADLRSSYNNFWLVRRAFGQVPGGMFGADENARMGYFDPRQGIETCGIVEQMASDEMLLRQTGDPFWADHCEDVAFNSLPAAFMPDLKSLRYFTSPNMVLCDDKNHSPGIENSGPFLMMNPFSSRCCQHNHSQAFPYYSENLWMASPDNGLAAVLFNSCEVKAKVASGKEVVIKETTNYPFDEQITFKITLKEKVNFPIYIRIPEWCKKPAISVNDKVLSQLLEAGKYVRIETAWENNDMIVVSFPMELNMRTWQVNQNSISLNYGPLTFSLKIKEQYVKTDSRKSAVGDSKWQEGADQEKWPSWQILPLSPWNYGLLFNDKDLSRSFEVVRSKWPENNFPFTQEAVPLQILAKGKKIPSWGLDKYGLCTVLPAYPVKTNEPEESITLIPMGAARLRISSFPQVR
jgi:hypothetical protein